MKPVVLALVGWLAVAVPLTAQSGNQAAANQANQAQLRLVVVDQTGAGIPNATVVVTPVNGQPVTAMSDDRGVVTMPPVAAGQVTVHVEFPGFEPYDATLTLRRGATNQNVTLGIAGLQEEVVVSNLASTDDRSGNAQTTTLEQDEIDALPDDPDDLADALTQMTGGAGATFQVNGFRGGRLPSREEIRQIRFRTNSFSADNHDAGRTQIEIITRPNVRAWSGNVNMNLRTSLLNARNAFATTETPEEFRRFNVGFRGPIVAGKTALRFTVDGNRSYDTPTIYALNEDGSTFQDTVRRPFASTNVTAGIEHALSPNQTLRTEYRRQNMEGREPGRGRRDAGRTRLRADQPGGSGAFPGAGCGGEDPSARVSPPGQPADGRGAIVADDAQHQRHRRVQQGRRRRQQQQPIAHRRGCRQLRLQHRPQARDARRRLVRRRQIRELRRPERRGHVHLRRSRLVQRGAAAAVHAAAR
jgi:hypothetical protein